MSQPEANEERVGILNLIFGDEGKSRAAFKGGAARNVQIQSSAAGATANFVNAIEAAWPWGVAPTAMGSPIIMAHGPIDGPPPSVGDVFTMTPLEQQRQLEQMQHDHAKAVLGPLKKQADVPKSDEAPTNEKAHNSPMTEVTRELLDAKLDSVRAEVRASIAESSKETVAAMGQLNTQMAAMQGQMLTEMQGLRADFANMLKDVTKEMAATGVAVANVGGKVEGLEGKVDGLKSSINMLQFVVGTVVVGGAAIIIGLMQVDLAKNPPTPAAPAAAVTQPAK